MTYTTYSSFGVYDNYIYRTLGVYDKETDFLKKESRLPTQNFSNQKVDQSITTYTDLNSRKNYPDYSSAYETICQKENNLIRGNVNVFIEK
jgi:hypothetical protein